MEEETVQTKDDVIRYLVELGAHDESDVTMILDNLVGKEHPVIKGVVMTPSLVLKYIEDFGLMDKRHQFGWITPQGRFLGCDHAAHERLLYSMGLETAQIEEAGWARVGLNTVQSLYRFTAPQRQRLKRLGREIDEFAERMKPVRATAAAASSPKP